MSNQIPRMIELTPPSLRTFDMISIYSTTLCAVSRKKHVTTASHAAGTTDSIVKNVQKTFIHNTCLFFRIGRRTAHHILRRRKTMVQTYKKHNRHRKTKRQKKKNS